MPILLRHIVDHVLGCRGGSRSTLAIELAIRLRRWPAPGVPDGRPLRRHVDRGQRSLERGLVREGWVSLSDLAPVVVASCGSTGAMFQVAGLSIRWRVVSRLMPSWSITSCSPVCSCWVSRSGCAVRSAREWAYCGVRCWSGCGRSVCSGGSVPHRAGQRLPPQEPTCSLRR